MILPVAVKISNKIEDTCNCEFQQELLSELLAYNVGQLLIVYS